MYSSGAESASTPVIIGMVRCPSSPGTRRVTSIRRLQLAKGLDLRL